MLHARHRVVSMRIRWQGTSGRRVAWEGGETFEAKTGRCEDAYRILPLSPVVPSVEAVTTSADETADETGAASSTSSQPQEATLRISRQKAAAEGRWERRCGGSGPRDAGMPLHGNNLLRGMGDGSSREPPPNMVKAGCCARARPKVKLALAGAHKAH